MLIFWFSFQASVWTRRVNWQDHQHTGKIRRGSEIPEARKNAPGSRCEVRWPQVRFTKADPVHNYAGGIWKRSFYSENASNVFRPNYAGENWDATITGHFEFVVGKNLGMEITWLSWCRHRIRKSPVFKMFSVNRAGVFNFLQFEERFRKVPFSWRISVDDRPNRRNEAAFLISSGIAWTGTQLTDFNE